MSDDRMPDTGNISDEELLRMVYLMSDLLKTMVRNHELDAHTDNLRKTYNVLLKEMQKRFRLNKMFITYRVDVEESKLNDTEHGFRYLFGTSVQPLEDDDTQEDVSDMWFDAMDDIDEFDDD